MALFKRDGEIIRKGRVSGKDVERGLVGPRVGKRTVNDDGSTTVRLSPDEARRMIVGPRPVNTVQSRDGVAIQWRGGLEGAPPQIRRFNRIRELRELRGLSVEDLAAQAFVPPVALARWEAEDDGLDVPARDQVAAAFEGLTVDDVFPPRKAGFVTSDGFEGLPSLQVKPVPAPAPLTEDETYVMREREAADAREAVAAARDAEELAAAQAALSQLERELKMAEIRQQLI